MNVAERLHELGFSSPGLGLLGEAVEDTLGRFQAFHGLRETRVVDEPTLEALTAIRACSLPDYMPLGESLGAWPDPHIHWGFANNWRQDMATVQAAFEWAGAKWSKASKGAVKFTFCDTAFPSGARSMMLVETGNIDGASGTLAWSELANNRDGQKKQKYDSSENWQFAVLTGKVTQLAIELCLTAMHEIGHFLGIPHIGGEKAVMNAMYNPALLELQPADIRELLARYPGGSDDTPTTPVREFTIRVVGDPASVRIS